MALIRCPECGREVSDRAVACPNCGMPVSEMLVKPQYCHSCGAPLTKGALFCTECGTKVTSTPDTPQPQTPHTATAPMPPAPPKPRETPKAEPTQHTPLTPPATPKTETPATAATDEKVEMPNAIKPKNAPSLGLSEKAGKRRAEALARKKSQSNNGKPAPENPAPADTARHTDGKSADNVDMPAMVTPKAAPSIPTPQKGAGKPVRHNIHKPVGKPQPPTKTEPVTEPGPEPVHGPAVQMSTTATTPKTATSATMTDNDSVDDSQFYEPYDDSYQPFEQQLAQNKEKQKKNIIMTSVIIFTIAVVGICIWVFASVDDDPTVTEVVQDTPTATPAPQWLQGEWYCQGSAFIDGKQTMVNSFMTIKGDSVTISDYMGKAVEGKYYMEGTDLVCTAADGEEIRLVISEEYKTVEYAGGLSYKRGRAGEPVAEPAQQPPTTDVNAKENVSRTAAAKSKKPRKNKHTKSQTAGKKPSNSTNTYTSKKRSPSMPEF